MKTFEELGLKEKILKTLREASFSSPTEIQEKAIPLILEGKDVIGSSATGSGKTLAFGLGIIEKIDSRKGPQVLILTPTRELADQVSKVFRSITKEYDIRSEEVYGGVSMTRQIERIPKSEIIIGTPGRILDHLQRRTLNLSNLKVLILDEADRMSDMGFLPDIQRIIESCPKKRQTLLFSATMSKDVDYISKKYMVSPSHISVKSHVDPSKLKQVYYEVENSMKFSFLVHLLKQEQSKLIMVFCNTRINSDMIASNLKRYGFETQAIHGGLNQNKRNALMSHFHKGNIKILVCTDVAARGLDIKGITHVYNYDIPATPSDYIHRIGRTARAGKDGMAISIVSRRDHENFRRVIEYNSVNIERQEMPEVEKLHINFESKSRGRSDSRSGFSRGRSDSRSGFSRGRSDSRPSRPKSNYKPRRY